MPVDPLATRLRVRMKKSSAIGMMLPTAQDIELLDSSGRDLGEVLLIESCDVEIRATQVVTVVLRISNVVLETAPDAEEPKSPTLPVEMNLSSTT